MLLNLFIIINLFVIPIMPTIIVACYTKNQSVKKFFSNYVLYLIFILIIARGIAWIIGYFLGLSIGWGEYKYTIIAAVIAIVLACFSIGFKLVIIHDDTKEEKKDEDKK